MFSFSDAMRSATVGAVALRERWQSGVAYDPLSARTTQDPYPAYAALRARAPVHRSRLLKAWVFTRHADVGAIHAQDEGEQLSERETLNMLRLLLSAGTETTANLIGNGVLALFRNPDQLQRLRDDPGLSGLDIDRRQGRHLSFGGGIHHCLGAPLARMEGRIVLEMLLDRFKSMRLLGDRPRFRQGIVVRGLQSLQVKALP